MKPIFKNTAMAVLVSFGLTGCFSTGSSDTANKESTPTPVSQPSTPAIQPSTPAIQPSTSPNQSSAPEVAKKLDKNDEEWRHIKLTGENGFDLTGSDTSQGKSKTTQYAVRIYESEMVEENQGLKNSDLASTNAYYVDLNQYNQGVNSGVISGDSKEFEVREYEYNSDTKTFSIWFTNEVNYHIVNQPYSSYGILFTNENNIKQFGIGQNAGLEGTDNIEYQVGKLDGENVIWNKEVEGSATYKGSAIISRLGKPITDGRVVLNAHFENGLEKSKVDGSLHFTYGGKEAGLELPEAKIDNQGAFVYENKSENIEFSGKFVGKDFNDVIGSAKHPRYDAVFGATKQK